MKIIKEEYMQLIQSDWIVKKLSETDNWYYYFDGTNCNNIK